MTQQLILIAGPYRSGTDGIQERIDANLARLENAALAVYERGHIPVARPAAGEGRRVNLVA